MLMTLAFVTLAVAQPGAASGVAAGVAILTVALLLGARYAATVIGRRAVTVGNRARAHRESLVGMPAPQHPATPGRTRSRAPAGVTAAA